MRKNDISSDQTYTVRNSSVELLRIILIFFIILMHTLGRPTDNDLIDIWVDVLGNTGVTCFLLISGYYGIHLKIKKIIHIDITCLTYSVLTFLIVDLSDSSYSGESMIGGCLESFFPIISNRYWFISCYIFLCLLSPFFNEMIQKMSQDMFRKFIICLSFLFLFIPTMFGFDIMGKGGKDFVHVALTYFIGFYLRKYIDERWKCRQKYLIVGFFVICCLNVLLNYGFYMVTGINNNYYARDNSLFIMFQAISLFLIFKNMHFHNALIDRLAKNVMAVYISEGLIRYIIRSLWDYTRYLNSAYYLMIGILTSLLILFAGILGNEIREMMFGRINNRIIEILYDHGTKIYHLLDRSFLKYL